MTTRTAIGLVALSFVGCYSDAPLDPVPQLPVERKLLGTWWCRAGDDKVGQLKVNAIDRFRYAAIWREPNHKPERYEAFASLVGSQMIINVEAAPKQNLGWEHPWTFVAVEVSAEVLHMRDLNPELLFSDGHRPKSSPDARRVLEKAIAQGQAFTEDGPCYRSKDLVH